VAIDTARNIRMLSIETGFNLFQKNVSKKICHFSHRLKAVTIVSPATFLTISIETGFNPFQKNVSKKTAIFSAG